MSSRTVSCLLLSGLVLAGSGLHASEHHGAGSESEGADPVTVESAEADPEGEMDSRDQAELRALATAYRDAYRRVEPDQDRVGSNGTIRNLAQTFYAVVKGAITPGISMTGVLEEIDRDEYHVLWGSCNNHANLTSKALLEVEQEGWAIEREIRLFPAHQWVEVENRRTGETYTFDGWAGEEAKLTAGSQAERWIPTSRNPGENLLEELAEPEATPPEGLPVGD